MLRMFQTLLSETQGLHKYLQKAKGYEVADPSILKSSKIETSSGTRSDLSTGDSPRLRVFFLVLDRMLEELQNRFSGIGGKIWTVILALFRAFPERRGTDTSA